jgi:hypothetical protein
LPQQEAISAPDPFNVTSLAYQLQSQEVISLMAADFPTMNIDQHEQASQSELLSLVKAGHIFHALNSITLHL